MATIEVPRRSTLDWALEAISLAALAAMFTIVWLHWLELSEIVGRRFGASGRAKNAFWIIWLMAAGLWFVMTVAAASLSWVKWPSQSERHLPETLRLQRSMMLWVKAVMMLAIGYIEWVEVRIALGKARSLGGAFTPILTATILLIIVVYLVRIARCPR
jgi:hypothetical protein